MCASQAQPILSVSHPPGPAHLPPHLQQGALEQEACQQRDAAVSQTGEHASASATQPLLSNFPAPPTCLNVDFFLATAAGAGEGLALGVGLGEAAGLASSLLDADESSPAGEGSPAKAGLRYWHLQHLVPSGE